MVDSMFPNVNKKPFSLTSKNILLIRNGNSRNTSDRGISNWNEIQEILLTSNFVMVDLGSLTLFEQIQIYKEAESVIGLHGGHFSQMFIARESTNILEIFSGLYSRCFQDMADQYGLRYHSIRAEKQKGEWHLDPKKILRVIETMLL
jgi:capsular polysaccharide biosynthesis protein